MRVFIKVILTFLAIVIATPIFAVTQDTPILKLALLAGMLAGLTAIWKYNPEKNKESGNEISTQKENNHKLNKN